MENPSIPMAPAAEPAPTGCGAPVQGVGARMGLSTSRRPDAEPRARCSSPGSPSRARLESLEALSGTGGSGRSRQRVPELLSHVWRASHARCRLRFHFLSGTERICSIPASCRLLGSEPRGGKAHSAAGETSRRNRCQAPAQGARCCPTAPSSIPASHAARTEPHWEAGRPASPMRAARGQPSESGSDSGSDDSRGRPAPPHCLHAGAKRAHAPAPPRPCPAPTPQPSQGRNQPKATTLRDPSTPSASPEHGLEPAPCHQLLAPHPPAAPGRNPNETLGAAQPGHPRATSWGRSPRHRQPRLPGAIRHRQQ